MKKFVLIIYTTFINSKALHYIIIRYVSFFLQFINNLFIAKLLGPFYFGVYGFILILLQYFNYSNLGLQYSINFFFSKKRSNYINDLIFSNSVFLSLICSTILTFCFFLFSLYENEVFKKYILNQYYFLIYLIGLLQILNQLYLNVFRVVGKIFQINIFQIIIPLLQILGFLFFVGKDLFMFLLYVNFLGNLFSLYIFYTSSPINFKFKYVFIHKNVIHILFKKAISLLLYNISFYLIVLTTLTIASIFYSINDFGNLILGNNLSNAVVMLIGSVSFLLFPKIISLMKKTTNKSEIVFLINKSNDIYVLFILLFIFLAINIFPFLQYFLPEYYNAFIYFKLLLISQIFFSFSFGHCNYLLAISKEKLLTKNALSSLFINLLLISLIIYFNFNLIYICWSIIITALFYSTKSIYDVNILIYPESRFIDIFKYNLPSKFLMPILILTISIILENTLLSLIALIYFIISNRNDFFNKFKIGFNFFNNFDKI